MSADDHPFYLPVPTTLTLSHSTHSLTHTTHAQLYFPCHFSPDTYIRTFVPTSIPPNLYLPSRQLHLILNQSTSTLTTRLTRPCLLFVYYIQINTTSTARIHYLAISSPHHHFQTCGYLPGSSSTTHLHHACPPPNSAPALPGPTTQPSTSPVAKVRRPVRLRRSQGLRNFLQPLKPSSNGYNLATPFAAAV
jgi:hypothetical protein